MACKFCPKIRKTDWIFIFIAGFGFYIADKLERPKSPPLPTNTPIQAKETSHSSNLLDLLKPLPKDASILERKKRFEQLQKACLFEKNKKACEAVF
ncbi:hypothetical protein [Helicobacter cetorum]|uniref:hypothetical protein n=1 Tax=Helicobacter cetorum TaxID=138563 RepID=UPI000CF06F27|nr:hypothetical protein [Helicobacter cetorum]